MGVSIQLPEYNFPRQRRPTFRLLRKLLSVVFLAIVLIFWFLGSVPWMSFEDDLGIEIQATGATAIDLRAAMVGMNNLVIVTCHAIWLGGPTAGENETEW